MYAEGWFTQGGAATVRGRNWPAMPTYYVCGMGIDNDEVAATKDNEQQLFTIRLHVMSLTPHASAMHLPFTCKREVGAVLDFFPLHSCHVATTAAHYDALPLPLQAKGGWLLLIDFLYTPSQHGSHVTTILPFKEEFIYLYTIIIL
jgi:hypothetical protein